MGDKVKISVVILTKNEEKNIKDCLDTVKGWADEIIIVDDESKDSTLEIVRLYTDKIFVRKMDNEGRHRNWAYNQCSNEWVLSLDADERLTEEVKREIYEVLKNSPSESGFAIPRRNYIGNVWIKYGGWYPSAQLKLFKKDKFRFEEVYVHPRAFLEGKCGKLKNDIIHYSYKDIEDFVSKLNRQTTWEAKKWIETNRKMSLAHIIWRTVDRFFRRYLRKKSYRDGLYGFAIAFFDSLYQILSYLKYRELKHKLVKRYGDNSTF